VDRSDTAVHEAVHGCVASLLGRRVLWLRIDKRPVPGRSDLVELGGCMLEPNRQLGRADLAVFLAAGMYEGSGVARDDGAGDHGVWPPLWPLLDGKGDRHQVHCLARLLGLTEADYRDIITKTRELLAEPELQIWIARVASSLDRKGRLSGGEVAALRPGH
jgi:hypothetical protein